MARGNLFDQDNETIVGGFFSTKVRVYNKDEKVGGSVTINGIYDREHDVLSGGKSSLTSPQNFLRVNQYDLERMKKDNGFDVYKKNVWIEISSVKDKVFDISDVQESSSELIILVLVEQTDGE